jgi:hypothetical protein
MIFTFLSDQEYSFQQPRMKITLDQPKHEITANIHPYRCMNYLSIHWRILEGGEKSEIYLVLADGCYQTQHATQASVQSIILQKSHHYFQHTF